MNLWGDYNDKMRGIVKTFRDLPNYNVVFTALDAVEKDENAARYTGISLYGKISDAIPALFDEVFYLFTEEVEDTMTRKILCHKVPRFKTKDRSGCLGKVEPADLDVIIKKIKGGKK